MAPKLLVVAGPSGVGKGTLIGKLRARFGGRIAYFVSHTTRAPRVGESSGREYHFVSEAAFDALKAQGAFLESAVFSGNQYGTSRLELEKAVVSGKIGVLEIELCGVAQIQAAPDLEVLYVFIYPPSADELERRLRSRGTDAETAIQRRLANVKAEIEKMDAMHCDLRIVNDEVEAAYAELERFFKSHFAGAAAPEAS